jgi:serine/threonine protein kinase
VNEPHDQPVRGEPLPSVSEIAEVAPVPFRPNSPEIPGYRVEQMLGYGGMGVVWRATQLYPEREVALKQMNPQALQSEKARARFRMEVELAVKLEHPNIARVYDCCLDREPYFFTMEWIKGIRLDEYVQANNLTPRQIIELVMPLCSAILHAHQHGVMHRDLKPSNILVTEDGQPHIVDFGVAKRLDDSDTGLTVSDSGGPGTLFYMSPEQVIGKAVDTRTDIYSLGIILYHLLTGRFPYDLSGSRYECMQNIERCDPIPPRRLVHKVDADLEAILLKCLAKAPSGRYQSAAELQHDLACWLEGLPIVARSVSSLYLLRKVVTRYRYTSSVVALLFVIVVSSACISFDLWRTAQKDKNDLQKTIDQWGDDQVRQEGLYRALSVQELGFQRFLKLWRDGRQDDARLVANLLASASVEKRAAFFLLDPSEPGAKAGKFRDTMGPDLEWFVDYLLGEDLLRRGQKTQALEALRRSYEALQSGQQTSQVDNVSRGMPDRAGVSADRIKAMLFSLGQGSP